MARVGAVELSSDLPRPHSRADGEQWPPDGTAQPRTPDEQAGIGLSYPAGQDFGAYVQALGRCPVLWREVDADLRCDVPFSAGNVHPHTGLLLFALAVNLRPKVIIETGTFFGYSTWFLAEALRWWGEGKVYSIDPDLSHVSACVREHPHVSLIQGWSQDVLPKLLPDVHRIDMAFLDSYKRMALAEFGLMEPAVHTGGLVVFHDTQVFNTGRALHRKLSRLDGWDTCLFAGTPSKDDPHSFFGNADDRGLLLLRRREVQPFLNVADHGTYSERLGDALLDWQSSLRSRRAKGGQPYGACRRSSGLRYRGSGLAEREDGDVTEIDRQEQEWHRHYYGGKLGLAILMHDELDLVAETIGRMRRRVARLILARTGTDLPEEWPQHLDAHELLADLPPDLSRWEIPARAITRGYACLARMAAGFEEVDWWVFLTGDTVLLHEYGLERLAASAEQVQADVSVCQAIGQDFHRADLTLADLEAGGGGGRKQSSDLADFMPQLFLVRGTRVREGWLREIPVTNRWCSEQCLGDCLPAGHRRHVYATVAHQFQDGVVPQAKGAPGAT